MIIISYTDLNEGVRSFKRFAFKDYDSVQVQKVLNTLERVEAVKIEKI